jgi:hypothetical protein
MAQKPARSGPPPRRPGSRLVGHAPDLIRVIRQIQADLRSLATAGRLETLTVTTYGAATGTAATAASLTGIFLLYPYRSGNAIYADVIAGTGAASIVGADLYVPDLTLSSGEVQTPAGGTEQIVRLSLPLPDAWGSGEAHQVQVRARRVSGTDATTVRVLRAWQR